MEGPSWLTGAASAFYPLWEVASGLRTLLQCICFCSWALHGFAPCRWFALLREPEPGEGKPWKPEPGAGKPLDHLLFLPLLLASFCCPRLISFFVHLSTCPAAAAAAAFSKHTREMLARGPLSRTALGVHTNMSGSLTDGHLSVFRI